MFSMFVGWPGMRTSYNNSLTVLSFHNPAGVPATTVHVVGKDSALSNEVCKVELGGESFKVSGISMDKKC